jgi:hypothetical protein
MSHSLAKMRAIVDDVMEAYNDQPNVIEKLMRHRAPDCQNIYLPSECKQNPPTFWKLSSLSIVI